MHSAEPSHSRQSSFFFPCLQMRAMALHFLHLDLGIWCSHMVGCGPLRALSASADAVIIAPDFGGSAMPSTPTTPTPPSGRHGSLSNPPGGGAGGGAGGSSCAASVDRHGACAKTTSPDCIGRVV